LVFELSPLKILVVVAVILLLLGPDKLPETAHRLGLAWRSIKKLQEKVESEVRDAIPDLPSTGDIARMARSPVTLLNQLADQAEARSNPMSERVESSDVLDAEPTPPLISQPTPVRRTESSTPPSDPSLN
jgi:TatA/E family protein of Tat protein translocase